LQDLPARVEGEDNTNRLAFEIEIVEHDVIGKRRDLF
jgi:hypothetical protein